jgi:hypothetical protein
MKFAHIMIVSTLLISTLGCEKASMKSNNSSKNFCVSDWRNIRTGSIIPHWGYCDQPYITKTKDGDWLCLITIAHKAEHDPSKQSAATLSRDFGKSWSTLITVDKEDKSSLEGSHYPVPLTTPSGRIYALTALAFTYSDDDGLTWSKRYKIPWREELHPQEGYRRGWTVGKPLVTKEAVLVPWALIRTPPGKGLKDTEVFFHRSSNILTETDPEKIEWEIFPKGPRGLKLKNSRVNEEPQIQQLDDGRLIAVFRTTIGEIGQSYSSDMGRNWTTPEPARYAADERILKHPRACPAMWKTEKGQLLLWHHNHGGKDFSDRNPVWISGGIINGDEIMWSEPEILLYEPQVDKRISYPDLVEEKGRYWISETEKTVARIHYIDPILIEKMAHQGKDRTIEKDLLLLEWNSDNADQSVSLPRLPDLAAGGGFAIDIWLDISNNNKRQILLDNTAEKENGFRLIAGKNGRIIFELNDTRGLTTETPPEVFLESGLHHLVIIVDGGPKIVSLVKDGTLYDGLDIRKDGRFRFDPKLTDINGTGKLRLPQRGASEIRNLRIYGKILRTAQAVAHYHAGLIN